MKTPEGKEKDKVKKYLKSIGAWHFSPYMAGRGGSGVPDIIACIKGTFWGIEVKREDGKLTALQEARLNQINASGGCSVWGTAEVVIVAIEWWRGSRGSSSLVLLGRVVEEARQRLRSGTESRSGSR